MRRQIPLSRHQYIPRDPEPGMDGGLRPAVDPRDEQTRRIDRYYRRCELIAVVWGFVVACFLIAYISAHLLRWWLS